MKKPKKAAAEHFYFLLFACLVQPTNLVKTSRQAATEGKSYSAVRCKSCSQCGLIVCHRQTASAEKWTGAGMHLENSNSHFLRVLSIVFDRPDLSIECEKYENWVGTEIRCKSSLSSLLFHQLLNSTSSVCNFPNPCLIIQQFD